MKTKRPTYCAPLSIFALAGMCGPSIGVAALGGGGMHGAALGASAVFASLALAWGTTKAKEN